MINQQIKETIIILHELECLKSDMLAISDHKAIYRDLISKSEPIFRIFHNSYKLFVIGLVKMLDPKEHFCLSSFIDYLIKNDNDIEWKRTYDKSKLSTYRDEIIQLQIQHLKDIKILRDKFYAHTDRNRKGIVTMYNLKDACIILSRMQEIFEDIILHLNNQKIKFIFVPEITSTFVSLHKYNLVKEFVDSQLQENPNSIELNSLKELMIK